MSASGPEVVEPIGQMLGADAVIATRIEVVDGKYTGEIEHYVYAENKAMRSRTSPPIAATTWRRATRTATRSPTCTCSRSSGHPFAVNPDKELRRKATANGWPVLVFNKPVELRSKMSPSKPTLAAIAAASAVAVATVVYVGAKRRLARSSTPA